MVNNAVDNAFLSQQQNSAATQMGPSITSTGQPKGGGLNSSQIPKSNPKGNAAQNAGVDLKNSWYPNEGNAGGNVDAEMENQEDQIAEQIGDQTGPQQEDEDADDPQRSHRDVLSQSNREA